MSDYARNLLARHSHQATFTMAISHSSFPEIVNPDSSVNYSADADVRTFTRPARVSVRSVAALGNAHKTTTIVRALKETLSFLPLSARREPFSSRLCSPIPQELWLLPGAPGNFKENRVKGRERTA